MHILKKPPSPSPSLSLYIFDYIKIENLCTKPSTNKIKDKNGNRKKCAIHNKGITFLPYVCLQINLKNELQIYKINKIGKKHKKYKLK